jgi:uncharacterized protein with PQ loop repeat
MVELLGYLGAILLTLSAVPQLIKTYRTRKVNDLSIAMLLSWSFGCFSMFLYILVTQIQWPLLVNYFLNTTISVWIIILYYKYRS